jgi:hypothetical protein
LELPLVEAEDVLLIARLRVDLDGVAGIAVNSKAGEEDSGPTLAPRELARVVTIFATTQGFIYVFIQKCRRGEKRKKKWCCFGCKTRQVNNLIKIGSLYIRLEAAIHDCPFRQLACQNPKSPLESWRVAACFSGMSALEGCHICRVF